ncbi:ABC transporter permease [Anaeromyxobacter paludicola]|uniref:ABC transporter permease n=1 Tax=Anaeromyxobacter paludicola TaxID=2918171 RepID=A0ABN6NEV9_9BACT|nr:ABC transporter permease [Anaeromyxobacter paludicola]BDG10724.1 ABC transporter permease [Anaeromyxobacter paludicola]
MLSRLVRDPLLLSLAQAGVAALAALAVALLARRRRIHVERELLVALVRGLAQISAVGSVLLLMLEGPGWLGVLALAGMMVAAAATSARRARRVPGAFRVSLQAIAAGSGTVIALMALAGVVETHVTVLVPVGSMLIASAMNANGLALDRFRADVVAHRREVESALALGAAPEVSVAPHLQSSFRASLIPAIDNLRSLGIVWIPGLMTGMVLSGTPPLHAAIYQFVTIAMIFASSGLTCLVGTTLIRAQVFSEAEQLLLQAP